jgi:hypothetical protein
MQAAKTKFMLSEALNALGKKGIRTQFDVFAALRNSGTNMR